MGKGRILITGSSGFVGRHLVAKLISAGRSVTLALRRRDAAQLRWQDNCAVRLIETGPIEDCASLKDAMSDVSTVIHLAGLAHVQNGTESSFIAANSVATDRLAEAALKAGVGVFIHMSSLAAVTGNVSQRIINDQSPRMPVTPYGRSKCIAEDHVSALSQNGILAVSLRPALITGSDAGGNWGAFQRLAASGVPLPFANVENRRSLVSIETVIEAIMQLCLLKWPTTSSGAYCLADKGTVSLKQIVTELRRGMSLEPRLFPFPPGIISSAALLVGQKRRIEGMLGNLEVDADRFVTTFSFDRLPNVCDMVRQSGAAYTDAGPVFR